MLRRACVAPAPPAAASARPVPRYAPSLRAGRCVPARAPPALVVRDEAPSLPQLWDVPARLYPSERPLVLGTPVELALRPRVSLYGAPSRSLLEGNRLQRGFSFGNSAGTGAASSAPTTQSPPLANASTEQQAPALPAPITEAGLAFVNRFSEALRIAEVNIGNKSQSIGRHCTLVTAGQMFGAGKTMLGLNAVKRAGKGDVKKELLSKHSTEHVNDYLNARTVYINFKALDPSSYPNLSAFIRAALWDQLQAIAPAMGPLSGPLPELADICSDYLNHSKQALFIYWDEVGCLEGTPFDRFFGPIQGDDIKPRLQRHYDFWRLLDPLLSAKGVYTFVTGKSPSFALIGLQFGHPRISSPLMHVFVVLDALSEADITEAFDQSTAKPGVLLRDVIKFSNPTLKTLLIKSVAAQTAGQPRLVEYFLRGAITYVEENKKEICSEDEIEKAVAAGDELAQTIGLKERYTPYGTDPRHLFYGLLLAGIMDVPINLEEKLVYHNKETRALELIDRFNFYIAPVQPNSTLVNVRIAPCILKHAQLGDAPRWLAEYQPAFLLDLATKRIPRSLLSGGELLEWALRLRLAVTLLLFGQSEAKATSTWGSVLPVFKGTAFAEELVVRPSDDLVRPFSKVTMKAKKGSNLTILPSTVPDALERVPMNAMNNPGGESKSPDLFLIFKNNLVGLQLKHNNPEQALSFAELKEEIIKSNSFATYTGDSQKTFSLVIVAFSIGPQLQGWLDEQANAFALSGSGNGSSKKEEPLVTATPYLWRIKAGEYEHSAKNKDDENPSKKGKTKSEDDKFSTPGILWVPPNMEVVILKPGNKETGQLSGVEALLGKMPYNCLKDVLKDRKDLGKMLLDELSNAAIASGFLSACMAFAKAMRNEPAAKPFELESFLRDEAKIDDEGVKEYLPLLRENEIDEEVLMQITDAMLKECGITAGLDRKKILAAIEKRASGKR